jgi:hypothetical protein
MKLAAYIVGGLTVIGIVAVGCTGVTGLTTLLGGTSGDSVADVANPGITEAPAGRPVASAASIAVQVRNLTAKSADVTLRFFVNDVVVHLTLLRVPPASTSLVIGPDRADRFTAGGVDEDGDPLPEGDFLEGIDFGDGAQAVYQIGGDPNEPSPGQDLPDGTPVNDDDVEDTPGVNDPPQLVFLEPAESQAVPLGSVVTLVWRDADPDDDARIELALRPVEPGQAAITLAPIIAEDPDGVNDRLRVVIENVSPGEYEVLGIIRDPVVAVEAVAPGRLTVIADPENEAPSLTILQPATGISVLQDSSLAVAWSDEDDGPAYITFYLDADGVAFSSDDIQVSPPIAAGPDGPGADSGRVAIPRDVPLGEYELLGVINDGERIGTARAPGRVRVAARITPPPPPPSTQCSDDEDCLDTLFCNGQEICSNGRCYPGVPPCTFGETCFEAEGVCVPLLFPCVSDEECLDVLYCNGEETCGSDGRCEPGTPPCALGQTCDEQADECRFLGELCETNADCDDGLFCNGQEVCDGICYPGAPPCDFGETCDEEADECVALLFPCAGDAECDDGFFCNGLEFCSTNGDCAPGPAPCALGETCDEGQDACYPPAQCQSSEECLDGIFCNGQEQCLDGVCVSGPWPCAFGETCSEATGCVPLTSTCTASEDCEDGFFCNGDEFCEGGLCFPGEPPCGPGLLCDEDQQQCLEAPPVAISAVPAPQQPSVVDVGSPFCLEYFLSNYLPLPDDQMRFFAVPVDTGPEVEILPLSPPVAGPNGLYAVCVDFTPIDGILVDCEIFNPITASVYVELRLERLVGGTPTLVAAQRLKTSFTPSAEDVIVRVWCPR